MIKLMDILCEGGKFYSDNSEWYHGSATGDLRGGKHGLHLGTYKAAFEALTATIGYPVNGEWDGSREYGTVLLCGKKTLKERNIFPTGFNCSAPENDFYSVDNDSPVEEWSKNSPHSYNSNNKPAIKKYKITCLMTNTIQTPYPDFKANGYMKGLLKRGVANRGFYYKNEAEDFGSISVVVPNGKSVKEV